MKCKHCGKDLMDGAKFCVYCGKPIEVEEVKKEETVSNTADPFAALDSKSQEVQQPVSNEPIASEQPAQVSTPEDPFAILDQKSENTDNLAQPPVDNIQEIKEVQKETKVEEKTSNIVKEEVQSTVPANDKKPEEKVAQPTPSTIEMPKEPQKQEINIETKVVKKNNPILIVIILILLAIIVGGGFFVYTKYIEPSDTKKASNQTTNVDETVEKEQTYDLAKAKELVDKYYYSVATQPDQNLFTTTMTEKEKKNIALNNLKGEFKKIECSQISGYSVNASGQCSNGSDKFTEGNTIDYDSLSNKYKYLFGKSNEVAKENFEDLTYFLSWEYIKDKNIFLQTVKIGGLEGTPYYTNYFVKTAKIDGENLVVDVGYVFMSVKDLTDDSTLKAIIGGEEVTYKESETKKDTFEQEFKDKYLDKLDTYEITFKYEDDHYVFESIKKV